VAGGQRAAATIMDMPAPQRPTAAFCANDLVALGLLQEMARRGLTVPNDLAIVGYDDIEFASAAAVPLSSVRQPRQQFGRTAAQLLIEEALATDGHKHRQVIFQPELEVRRSSQGKAECRGRQSTGEGRVMVSQKKGRYENQPS
jgi:DNA-binding LacI/PurR family transcriptional regulator